MTPQEWQQMVRAESAAHETAVPEAMRPVEGERVMLVHAGPNKHGAYHLTLLWRAYNPTAGCVTMRGQEYLTDCPPPVNRVFDLR